MIITAYSTRHHGYTAFNLNPITVPNLATPWQQLTGYHHTPQEAITWARSSPGRMVSTLSRPFIERMRAIGYDHVGTITGRLKTSDPEFQDPIHEGFTRRPIVAADFSALEQRTIAHYVKEPLPIDDAGSRFAAHCEGYGMPDVDEVAEDVFAANAERELLDQRKPTAGRRGLYTEDQREALRNKASQRRPK